MPITARISLRSPRPTNTRATANGRSNEPAVESSAADRLEPITSRQHYGVIVKYINEYQEDLESLFFCGTKRSVFLLFSFPQVSGLVTTSLTHKVNLYKDLSCGYRQDTIPTLREEDQAGQNQLFYVNCLLCSKGICVKKFKKQLSVKTGVAFGFYSLYCKTKCFE
ncbi:hypothetical protein SAMN05444372_1124 [Flavobacterium micromati]|uniref:Uncharacterized protein n=1 Tax=Flavobacterium micromati TaxID=229205 RepID=A0A1M5NZ05_9FLAO|nr:hypothetical protein SAMN05444372_1124 [Flavobacterium micromati]